MDAILRRQKGFTMANLTDTPNAIYWRAHDLMYGHDNDQLGAYRQFLKVIETAPDSDEAVWSSQQIHNLESHWQWTTTIRTVEGRQEVEKVCLPPLEGSPPQGPPPEEDGSH